MYTEDNETPTPRRQESFEKTMKQMARISRMEMHTVRSRHGSYGLLVHRNLSAGKTFYFNTHIKQMIAETLPIWIIEPHEHRDDLTPDEQEPPA